MNDIRPLVFVTDEVLLEELLRLAAAADCELERVPDAAAARRRWGDAPLVVLDHAALELCLDAGLPRRAGVVAAFFPDPPPPRAWEQAVAIGAQRMVVLPGEEPWLIGAFADAVEEPAREGGRVLAVLGGRGGAGASVFAAAVALGALRRRRSALLVDCDSTGGGLDLVLGAERDDGLRWPELRLGAGRVTASSLHAALPTRSHRDARLTVLSCDRDGPGPSPEAVAVVVDAGRRAGETVVCDLPRESSASADAALERADLAVLVVPAEVRACAAARRVADRVRAHGVPGVVVVRGPAPGGLRPEEVAQATGLELLTSMRPDPGLDRALESGRLRPRGPLSSAARTALEQLDTVVARRHAVAGSELRGAA
ncbi:secretion/DNA translocation related CpaE-like protein [Herbihabitans rhizosphaerae]|uniref:Secretion/DNA translocation related CpaE-like protein n=1 Tax=Herbihabitans rhizosphaerae TaxID=1872711 RepID=A0A4Q7KYW7_9PSEU|nr:septum site-determining protein Ssd [Herbihabitans rhizosphaerae]RZS41261.1 secretion/DNA translocation related CpaE-like protein [Herbihabitans rhizosphaerae]